VLADLRSPLRYIGGKSQIIDWHVSRFPTDRELFVSTFLGGASEIFATPPGNEIGNDFNHEVHNFWAILRNRGSEFLNQIEVTPFSRQLFDELISQPHWEPEMPWPAHPDVMRAWRFFVINRQTFSGTGTGKKDQKPSWSISPRTRRRMNESVSAWWSAIDLLPEVIDRISCVALECKDFEEIIKKYDSLTTFFYCDPPYDLGNGKTNNYYGIPFSPKDHVRLARILHQIKGKALVCGYPTSMYLKLYGDWNRETIPVKKAAATGEQKEYGQETIWTNYETSHTMEEEGNLFDEI